MAAGGGVTSVILPFILAVSTASSVNSAYDNAIICATNIGWVDGATGVSKRLPQWDKMHSLYIDKAVAEGATIGKGRETVADDYRRGFDGLMAAASAGAEDDQKRARSAAWDKSMSCLHQISATGDKK